jgi:hypothetical protein
MNTNSSLSDEDTSLIQDDQLQSNQSSTTSFNIYDPLFIALITICNFTQGFRRLVELGLYFILRDKLKLQPSEISVLMGIMAFPWMIKIILAVISDSVIFLGSRRRSYLMANSAANFTAILCLMVIETDLGKYFIIFCLFISQICMTWCDCITDALMA